MRVPIRSVIGWAGPDRVRRDVDEPTQVVMHVVSADLFVMRLLHDLSSRLGLCIG